MGFLSNCRARPVPGAVLSLPGSKPAFLALELREDHSRRPHQEQVRDARLRPLREDVPGFMGPSPERRRFSYKPAHEPRCDGQDCHAGAPTEKRTLSI